MAIAVEPASGPNKTLIRAAGAPSAFRRAGLWFGGEVVWTVRVLVSSADRFYWDNGLTRAAALAYTTLFSLVPVLVLAIGILASFVVKGDDLSQVTSFVLRQFLPNMELAEPDLHGVHRSDNPNAESGGPRGQESPLGAVAPGSVSAPDDVFLRDSPAGRPDAVGADLTPPGSVNGEGSNETGGNGHAGHAEKHVFPTDLRINKKALDRIIISYVQEFGDTLSQLNNLVVVFLVVTAILLLNSIEFTLNEIWQVYQTRSLPSRVAIFCAIIVIWPVLALSAFYTTNYTTSYLSQWNVGYLSALYHYLLPFLIDFSAFLLLYFVVPKAPVKLRSACFGAFVAALLFGSGKALFAIYILRFASYTRIYETLAVIPIFLFWLYCAWSIVLFGAEVSYQAQCLPRQGKLFKRSLLSIGDGRLLLGIQAIQTISTAFMKGDKLPSELEMCEQLGCSSVMLKPVLDALERARIVARGEGGGVLTLSRDPRTVTLDETRRALLPGTDQPRFSREIASLFSSFADEKGTTLAAILDGGKKPTSE